jgi:hypothetical protein
MIVNPNNFVERLLWRSKECLDFVRTVRYSLQFAEYIVFLEDDVRPSWNYYQILQSAISEKYSKMTNWLMVSLYGAEGI